ncbi:MAG: hypothetical protein H3C35_00790 [Bacteroidetes bacterium]|nr:hypothetical protein [Bacteroidota bacterium]
MRYVQKQILFSMLLAGMLSAQVAEEKAWMSVGALHNWYSNYGSEREEGWVAEQQYGLQWPALYQHQDAQAAKGMWIGTTNYSDDKGSFQNKVVHVGPRATGSGEFFPVTFSMTSKYEPPVVTVDGAATYSKLIENNAVDNSQKYDRIIDNVVNTSIGLTMHRKIIGFSQQYHDNYIIFDYTFKNTGIINEKGTLRAPKTLTGVYIFFQQRWSANADVRYVIGNETGWGRQTMNDVRGDTTIAGTFFPGNADNDIRASYSWHGRYTGFSQYDNIGGPIFTPYYDKTDTAGRIGAPQFVGWGTLHVDTSPSDTTDNMGQPATTSYEDSDDDLNRNNDQYNAAKMISEYNWMLKGHVMPRHADKVGTGTDASLGRSGGYSSAQGYGPFTLAPGDSVRLVIAEAVAGLSREAAVSVGKQFKNGLITAAQKNDSVYTGRNALFTTFRRAIANYSTGWNIPQPPPPPKKFSVSSGAGKIILNWEPNTDNATDPTVAKWEVWRAQGRYDSTYYKVWEGTGSSYSDTSAALNTAYYYYLIAVGDPAGNTGAGMTPTGALSSNRYYTQTYLPAFRRTPPFKTLAEAKGKIRIVPNPYNISARGGLLYPGESDKISFVNIPGQCTVRIYSELGELIKTIEHGTTPADETGSLDYDMTTSSNQIIVSGVYIAVITTPAGEKEILKFVVIR